MKRYLFASIICFAICGALIAYADDYTIKTTDEVVTITKTESIDLDALKLLIHACDEEIANIDTVYAGRDYWVQRKAKLQAVLDSYNVEQGKVDAKK